LEKGTRKKGKKNQIIPTDSDLVTHPSTNPAEQGETCSLWYSDYAERVFLNFQVVKRHLKEKKNLKLAVKVENEN